MQYKYKNLKEKKSILYFNNLNFQKENYNILKSKFRKLKINNFKNKDFSKIVSIILPMNNFYSDKFFSKFPKLSIGCLSIYWGYSFRQKIFER